jgi:hypothetical protein
MFSTKKKIAALGVTAVAVASAGIAGAYWTTTGSGSDTGATEAGVTDALLITHADLTDMFPGDTPQDLVISVENESTQDSYVGTLKAYVTTSDAACTGADFKINGVAAPSTEGTAVALTWTPQDIDHGATVVNDDNTIQFNNLATAQDSCKDVEVTVHYLAS